MRTTRNEHLIEIRKAFVTAGWSVLDKISSNTLALRHLSVIAHPPRPAQ
ncbi:hypothetical protein [Streptomyces azureus]|nr:hypothetical protein [Streptomyces azureus]